MSQTEIVSSVLSLLAGIGIFLIGCNMMSSSLEAMGGHKLRNLFRKTGKSKWAGVGIGAAGTMVEELYGHVVKAYKDKDKTILRLSDPKYR